MQIAALQWGVYQKYFPPQATSIAYINNHLCVLQSRVDVVLKLSYRKLIYINCFIVEFIYQNTLRNLCCFQTLKFEDLQLFFMLLLTDSHLQCWFCLKWLDTNAKVTLFDTL